MNQDGIMTTLNSTRVIQHHISSYIRDHKKSHVSSTRELGLSELNPISSLKLEILFIRVFQKPDIFLLETRDSLYSGVSETRYFP